MQPVINKIIFSLSIGVFSTILALPSGHSVKQGKAKVANRGDQIVITSGKNAVIHWDQFSVGKGETAKFQMQDAKSSVINRVTGSNKSEILGRMESNGKIYLLNPKGILFGKDCEINVKGLVASTLDLLDRGGEKLFEGQSNASIVNLGKIQSNGGEVFLFAQNIENRGSIQAEHVGLGAGSQILLKPKGSERIFIKAGSGAIAHSGKIETVVAELKTKTAYEMAINVNGLVQAEGGRVHIQGGKIAFASDAVVDVSSQDGPGGVLKVGENIHENSVYVEEGAQFFVSGKPGGEVRFKANKMFFYGKVAARGIDTSDGGFVEVSACDGHFELNEKIDCRSDAGRHGMIFHDPPALIIDVSASSGPVTFGDSYLSGVLGGSSFGVATTGPGFESITFVDGPGPGSPAIAWTGDTTLSFTSGGTISATATAPTIINTAVAGGVNAIVMTANSGGTTSGNFIGIDLTPFYIASDGNNIVLDGTGGDSGSTNIGVVSGSLETGSGSITITGTSIGAAGATDNAGIRFTGGAFTTSSATVETGSGTLSATGVGGTGTSGNIGIIEAAFDGIVTASGLIRLTGTGGAATGAGNHGVVIPETSITSTGATFTSGAGIEIRGTGGSGSGNSHGISFTDTPASVMTDANPILLVGRGGSGGSGNIGISQPVEAEVSSTTTGSTGTITYRGTGGSGTGDCMGVYIPIDNPTPVVFSDGSDILITGFGGVAATGTGNIGIDIRDNVITAATSGGPGGVRLEGTGGSSGTSENHGIRIGSSGGNGTGVSALGAGDITLIGTGGAGTSINHGVFVFFETEIVSGTGDITITGTSLAAASDNDGVQISGSDTTIETAGAITITGTSMGAGSGNRGVAILTDTSLTGLGGGNVSITGTGGTGATDNQGILIEGSTVATLSSSMNFTAMDEMLLNAGGRINGSSGLITVQTDDALTINGNVVNTGVFPGTGGFAGSIGGDLTLTGSASGGAHIGSIAPLGISSDITFTSIGGNVLVDGGSTAAATGLGYAVIGHGKNTGAPYSGNITLSNVRGTVTVLGASAASGAMNGVGQIGHIALADSDVLNGNITIEAENIAVRGGSAGASAYARIGHGGRTGVVFATTSSRMLLLANNNISMTTQTGPAVITNPSTSASDPLFLVVDNANPAFPNFGPGTFSINTGSDLSTAAGELRIYTVQPSQNFVSELVNGSAYVPTPFNNDNNTNQYNIYYPAGTFISGAPFRFYYKTGESLVEELVAPFVSRSFFFLQVAEAQAEQTMPILQSIWYHGSFSDNLINLDPGFDPYYSFIFEDNVFWILNRSD